MIFISLGTFGKKRTKEMTIEVGKITKAVTEKEEVNILGFYQTLGRYDTVVIMEAPKAAMKDDLMVNDFVSTETIVTIPRKEAIKLVE